jgi:hypothetical protein
MRVTAGVQPSCALQASISVASCHVCQPPPGTNVTLPVCQLPHGPCYSCTACGFPDSDLFVACVTVATCVSEQTHHVSHLLHTVEPAVEDDRAPKVQRSLSLFGKQEKLVGQSSCVGTCLMNY